MRLRLVGALLLVPLLDVVLLVVLATRIGPVVTVALVVLTALIGLLLVRAEGRHTMARLQRKLAQGTPPTDELLDGALLLVAGALMLTPGYLTDLIGLLFVLPPTRYPIRLALKRYVVRPYVDEKTGGFATGNVYVGGFPNQDEGFDDFDLGFPGGRPAGDGPGGDGPGGDGPGGDGPGTAGPRGPTGRADDAVEMGEDDYEFSDVDADVDTDVDTGVDADVDADDRGTSPDTGPRSSRDQDGGESGDR